MDLSGAKVGRYVLVVSAALAVLVAAMIGIREAWSSGEGTSRFTAPDESVLTVLALYPPRVLVVDPVTLEVAQTIPLRSASIDLDGSDGIVVTAQCGRPGGGSDTVLGVLDLGEESLEYLETGHLDPEVVCVSGDTAMCLNGEVLEHGQAGALLDLPARSITSLVLPHGTVAMAGGQRSVWLAERVPGDDTEPLDDRLWVFDSQGSPSLVASIPAVAALDAIGERVWILHQGEHPSVTVRAGRAEKPELTVILDGLMPAARRICALEGGGFAVSDYDGADPKDGSGSVLIFDKGGAPTHRVEPMPGPAVMVETPEGLVVVCQSSGELVRVDIGTGEVLARREVTSEAGDLVDCVYVLMP
jgi:hypothetical protein